MNQNGCPDCDHSDRVIISLRAKLAALEARVGESAAQTAKLRDERDKYKAMIVNSLGIASMHRASMDAALYEQLAKPIYMQLDQMGVELGEPFASHSRALLGITPPVAEGEGETK